MLPEREGRNLLHLLKRHGHPACIDLREAKIALAGEEKANVREERLK